MPFTLRNLEEDLEALGSNVDGAPELESFLATGALERELRFVAAPIWMAARADA